ncbi:MAG: hypothetical protein ACRDTT_10815 [Pseudonocardiaceae bacterium]
MIQRAVPTTIGATVVSAVLAMSWAGVVIAVGVVIVLTIAVCWVLADADRPKRLALLLTAWRHGTPAPRRHTHKPNDSLAANNQPAGPDL